MSVIQTSQLMLYREIMAVCSQIHTKHINTLCGQNVELLNVKLAVHIVTAGLQRVNEIVIIFYVFVHYIKRLSKFYKVTAAISDPHVFQTLFVCKNLQYGVIITGSSDILILSTVHVGLLQYGRPPKTWLQVNAILSSTLIFPSLKSK